ncbi:MAG: four helix bundle protein [Candidatus Peribacteraceae bacterium]|nr:four helix bundle protein [Candidatus Peribacteraceae bacterium]MDD5740033.1 four helix bundle protein [Candidatus Peribacteraceae bacterium]
MKTFRFRDFQVYRDARKFRKKVASILKLFPTTERYRLVDQIHRSCLSVLLNIAEGSAKRSDADFARFLEMSICSLNECVAGFDTAYDDALVTEEIRLDVEKAAELLVKQLGGFIKSLRSEKVKC